MSQRAMRSSQIQWTLSCRMCPLFTFTLLPLAAIAKDYPACRRSPSYPLSTDKSSNVAGALQPSIFCLLQFFTCIWAVAMEILHNSHSGVAGPPPGQAGAAGSLRQQPLSLEAGHGAATQLLCRCLMLTTMPGALRLPEVHMCACACIPHQHSSSEAQQAEASRLRADLACMHAAQR